MFSRNQLYGPNGKMLTKSLFREIVGGDAPLSLGRHEREGCINLRSLYISLCVDDPTEVVFAETVFGDWTFWDNLRSSPLLRKHVEEWREVCEVKRKSLAFASLIEEVKKGGRGRLAAAKYLIDEPWKGKSKKVREKVNETSSLASKEIKEDLKRLQEGGYFQ